MTLQVPGEGADGDTGMPRGTLFVELAVGSDAYFKRDPRKSEDVHTDLPVQMAQAALGVTLDVLTLDGMVELKVPPGSQPGTKLLLRGKGISRVSGSGRGNQYVHLEVIIPKTLTARQRELLNEFTAEEASGEKATSSGSESSMFSKLIDRTFNQLKGYLKKDK